MPSSTNAATHLVSWSLIASTSCRARQLLQPVGDGASVGQIDRRRRVGAGCERAVEAPAQTAALPQVTEVGSQAAGCRSPLLRARLCGVRGQIALQVLERAAGAECPGQEHRLERPEAEQQVRPPDVAGVDAPVAALDRGRRRRRRADAIEGLRQAHLGDAAGLPGLPILGVRQIALPAEQMARLANRPIERQVLQSVNRVVVHEPLHRPEVGDRLGRLMDHAGTQAARR